MYRNHWKFKKRRIVQQLRGLTGKTLAPEKWVFVIGCYNSGTTLLKTILNEHTSMAALTREGVELCNLLPRPEEIGWPRMWSQCADYPLIPATKIEFRAEKIKRQWSYYINDDKIIIEKSISNMLRLEFISQYFQPAYFIHIVRNGYAVSEGIRRRAKPHLWGSKLYDRYPIELCAKQWVESDDQLSNHRALLPNLLEITYEELTEKTEDVLSRIAAFIEIPSFSTDLHKRKWVVHGLESKIQNMNFKSIENLTIQDINSIEVIAQSTLSKYGYKPINKQKDLI